MAAASRPAAGRQSCDGRGRWWPPLRARRLRHGRRAPRCVRSRRHAVAPSPVNAVRASGRRRRGDRQHALRRGRRRVVGNCARDARATTSAAGAGARCPAPAQREHLGVTALNGRLYVVAGRVAGQRFTTVQRWLPRDAALAAARAGAGASRRDRRRVGKRDGDLGGRRVGRRHELGRVRVLTGHQSLAAAPRSPDCAARPRRRRHRLDDSRDRRRTPARALGQQCERVAEPSRLSRARRSPLRSRHRPTRPTPARGRTPPRRTASAATRARRARARRR